MYEYISSIRKITTEKSDGLASIAKISRLQVGMNTTSVFVEIR